MNRIEKICSYIEKSDTFADVGCDHGYCAQYALGSGLCNKVYITDISAKCLKKAEVLLADYIKNGSCEAVCCDGLKGIDSSCGQVLIAGMGGEEIIGILKRGFIPGRFIFQPMKDAPALRKYLLDAGCRIECDDIFYDGKYYFIITGKRSGGTPPYSASELLLGRDSLKNPAIKGYASAEAEKRKRYLEGGISGAAREKMLEEYAVLKGAAEI